jgi:hypothetical protein
VYRIGVLYTSAQPSTRPPNEVAFFDELRNRGYVEGQNLLVEAVMPPDSLTGCLRLRRSWSRLDLT